MNKQQRHRYEKRRQARLERHRLTRQKKNRRGSTRAKPKPSVLTSIILMRVWNSLKAATLKRRVAKEAERYKRSRERAKVDQESGKTD